MLFNGLPIYDVDLNDRTIFENISIVDAPAIMEDFICLSKDTEIKFKVNEEKRIVSGPVLIPEQPIYRRNAEGKEFYVKFDAETIKGFAEKFFKDHRNTEGNVQHEISVNGVNFFESYLLNKERGIAPIEFSDLPDGTWMASAKIENDELWALIKDGTLRGFSVGIISSLKEVKPKEIKDLEEFVKVINNK